MESQKEPLLCKRGSSVEELEKKITCNFHWMIRKRPWRHLIRAHREVTHQYWFSHKEMKNVGRHAPFLKYTSLDVRKSFRVELDFLETFQLLWNLFSPFAAAVPAHCRHSYLLYGEEVGEEEVMKVESSELRTQYSVLLFPLVRKVLLPFLFRFLCLKTSWVGENRPLWSWERIHLFP